MFATFLILAWGAMAARDTPLATGGSTTQTDAAEPSRQELICRSRPRVGSRIAQQRVCRTREEWLIYENDLEQSRRDINDRGARGCNGPSAC